ncbi:MAG: alpha-E domain-containing protein [Porticoccaceae bacterium]|jgi:uncharacterized alpha-E superfamily protein|nr:alpha-E domain-containing protein [Porticoccaceae bacterium]
MLSRVANRLYWSARYLERSEGLARMINAYTHFILDTPRSSGAGWDVLIKIIDAEPVYFSRYTKLTEQNVIKFLLADEENLASLKASVSFARENMRTTRDVLPEEAWELVNELHLYTKLNVEQAVKRKGRYDFSEEIVLRNMQIDGLFDGSMNRDHSFEFIRLGRYLERCDMATRITDVGIAALQEKEGNDVNLEMSLWANLLASLSATSAYRREVGPIIEPHEATNFIFNYPDFPRSVRYCLDRVERVIRGFKNNEASVASLEKMYAKLDRFDAKRLSDEQIHRVIDQIQLELNRLNTTIASTWFFPESK